jgi:hypothetical protein
MRPVLSREQAPADSESSTAQTVERMAQHVRNSAGDPAVVWAAHHALNTAGGPNASQLARCKAVFYWLKSRVRFKTDDALIGMLFGERDQLELLISPPVLLRAAKPEGDCDDFTMCACALLNELGVPNQIVTVKADQPDPDRWSHVYCCANVNGQRVSLDCSHGDFPGWEVPHYYEKRYWDSGTGQAVASEPGSVPSHAPLPGYAAVGLHGLTRRGTPFRVPGRRGMGDMCNAADPDYDPAECADLGGVVANAPPVVVPLSLPTPTPVMTGPTPTAAQLSQPIYPTTTTPTATPAAISQLLNSGFASLQLALSPAGSVLVQNPNGSYSIQQPNAAGLTASSTTSLLYIGGAVIAVVVLASLFKK